MPCPGVKIRRTRVIVWKLLSFLLLLHISNVGESLIKKKTTSLSYFFGLPSTVLHF